MVRVENRISIFLKKEKRQPLAWEVCPKADFCNINKCPLYEKFDELVNDNSDFAILHKQRCIEKNIRNQIGTYFKLKNMGLTSREITSKRNWERLTEEEKKSRIEKIKKVSPVSRLLKAGCKIIPPRANVILKPQIKEENPTKNDILQETSQALQGREQEEVEP